MAMGAAYYIVLDNKDAGFDTFVNGKAVSRDAEGIAKIAAALNLPDINDLANFSDLAAEFGVDSRLEAAREKWFEPAEGLAWVRAVRDHISANPGFLAAPDRVLSELDEYGKVLVNAGRIGAKWHFAIDIRTAATRPRPVLRATRRWTVGRRRGRRW